MADVRDSSLYHSFQAAQQVLEPSKASQISLRSSPTNFSGLLLPSRGALTPSGRYSPSSSTISSSIKATPAFTIQPQEDKTVNISSYETGHYPEEELWSHIDSEAYSTSPMSLENMNLSEEVASLADLLPGSPDQMILPDMNPGPGKILLTGSSNHLMLPKGKKLITKDKAVVAPTVAEVTDDYKMDFDLLDTAFEQVKIEPAQEQHEQFNEMMMLAEYDVPVIHIAEPENNTNQVWSANSLFGENTGLSSNPNHYMMATVNPYEAEGLVSVAAGAIPAAIPEQAPEDQQDNANADDLLKFVMDETIGADIETFNTHFNRGLFTFFKKAELNGFVQFQRLIIEIYF